jgi:polyisoprenyl-teichoic acid--peptidoglycan teichoic acid transferase
MEENIRDNSRHNDRKKRKRRRIFIRRVRFWALIVVSILIGHFMGRAKAMVNTVLNKADRSSQADLSSVEVDENLLLSDESIINILLIGSDKRIEWTETGRSDSTMIATLDMKHKRIKITSLMRDLYVAIPEYGENRINAAYSFGGVGLLYQTIATNFNIKLDGYVIVDFAAFEAVIDTIGGVKIKLTDEEHEYLTTAYKKGSVLDLVQGVNNMNGKQALAYTRIRQDAQGDFGRTNRQRNVLQAIFARAKSMSISNLISLAEEVMPSVSTDLTNDEIISYMTSVITLGTTQIDQMRIPIDDSFEQDRINNKAVLIPDMQVNQEALNEFIFEYSGK